MTVKLLTEHHFEFLSSKEDYTGPSEYTLVKISLCPKSHVMALLLFEISCRGSNMHLHIDYDYLVVDLYMRSPLHSLFRG